MSSSSDELLTVNVGLEPDERALTPIDAARKTRHRGQPQSSSLKHEYSLKRDAQNRADAAEEAKLRADMDEKRTAADAKELRGRVIDGHEKYGRDEAYSHKRAAAIRTLQAKQDARNAEADEEHLKAVEKARAQGGDDRLHPVKTQPAPTDPAFTVWKDLDTARRQALIGVAEKYARLHDAADTEILDLNKTRGKVQEDIRDLKTAKRRYGKPGTRYADVMDDKDVEKHFVLYRQEHGTAADMVNRFHKELNDAHDRYLRQNEERAAMAARHATESRAAR